MADYLAVEPDDLRRSAEQHDLLAADLRKWGTIPQTWLDEYPDTYGTIAAPMHRALVKFYNDRHEKAERLAIRNEQTRDQLLRAAEELETHDDHGRQQVSTAGGNGFADPHGGGHAPSAPSSDIPAPVAPGAPLPVYNNITPREPISTAPGQPVPQSPVSPAVPTPTTPATAPVGVPTSSSAPTNSAAPTAPTGSLAPVGLPPQVAATNPGARPATVAASTGVPTASAVQQPRTTAPGVTARPGVGFNAPTMTPSQRVFTAGPSAGGPPPGPLQPGPLAASAHAAQGKSRPALVVGDTVNDDLLLARTLLAAVLAAVGDSAPGVAWATGVAVTRQGPVLMLISTEGRSWLPAGLFLPTEVVVPWRWEPHFRDSHAQAIAQLVGADDPALILADLVSIATHRMPIQLSALASSTAIPNHLRSFLPDDVAMADQVTAAPGDIDFSKPAAGLADRLDMAGTDHARHYAEAITDMDIETTCQKLVFDAQVQLNATEAGSLPIDEFIRRRSDELRLLYTNSEPSRQMLRDMLYAHEQMVMHSMSKSEVSF